MGNTIEHLQFRSYFDACLKSYMTFTRIESMPEIRLIPITPSVSNANIKGFGSFSTQYYDVNTGEHTLKLWRDTYKPQLHADYLLYHELTHVVDTERYAQRDKMKNVALKGYTEYHAAQVDFLKVLGAESIEQKIAFSLDKEVYTVTKAQTALSYVLEAHNPASEILARSDFPKDIETLSTTLGLIFNFLGRRSICMLYATDYNKYIETLNSTDVEDRFFGNEVFILLKAMLIGWLPENQINILNQAYLNIIFGMAEKYRLN